MTTTVPESGSLCETPLARLLLDLYDARFDGRLALSRGRTEKAFLLQDGAVVDSESSLPGERLTAVLEDAGLLGREDRERVEAQLRGSKGPEVAALLSLELLDPKQLFEGIRSQIRRRAVECFAWPDGRFAVTPGGERRADVELFRTDPFRLVQEGIQKHWPPDRMLADLGPEMARYASAGPRLGKIVKRLTLDATVERMIAGLSGTRTLGTIIGASAGAPAALAAFWVLHATGALQLADEPRASEDAGPPEIEIEIRDEAAAAAAAASAAAGVRDASGPGAQPRRGDTPEAEKMRAEVLDRLERLDQIDFYELLGVANDAQHAAIRKAYFLAAKRYHPDAIARLGLQDIRREAGEVFSKIAEANEVLSDAKRRAAYDERLAGGAPDIDLRVLAQAETFYRKGEILINMGDFRGALGYLKNAVELYPDEPVYQSDLGWAYYKKNPPEPELAMQHLEHALALDPGNAEAEFRKGVVARHLEP